MTEDEKHMERFVADHPLLLSHIPERQLVGIMLQDAKDANPERVQRFARAVALDRLTKLIECVQRGDKRGMRKLLKPIPEDVALKLLETITRTCDRLNNKPRP